MDHTAVLTKIIYGGSGIHVLIMLDMDHDVEISLHVVSVAVALWPHDICKGPERRENLNLFIQNNDWHILGPMNKRQDPFLHGAAILLRGRGEKKTLVSKITAIRDYIRTSRRTVHMPLTIVM